MPLNLKKLHVLVVGQPRGGTSLMLNMLVAAYPQFGHAEDEVMCLGELKLDGPRVSKSPRDSALQDEILAMAHSEGRILRTIAVIRDPRDVLTSMFHGGGYAADAEWYRTKNGKQRPVLGFRVLQQGITNWISHPEQPALAVRYEDMVTDPDGVQARVAAHIGLEPDGVPFAEFYTASARLPMKAGHRNQPLTTEFIGRWQKPEHRQRLVEVFGASKLLRSFVVELGYADDDAWFDALCCEEDWDELLKEHES